MSINSVDNNKNIGVKDTATKKKRKKGKLVEGHGINDYEGKVSFFEVVGTGDIKKKIHSQCDIYSTWKIMLRQCFSDKYINPSFNSAKNGHKDGNQVSNENSHDQTVQTYLKPTGERLPRKKPKNMIRKRMTVCDEWLSYSKFRDWAIKQNAFIPCTKHEGRMSRNELTVFSTTFFDRRNKLYSPETCVFVSELLNRFMHPVSFNGFPVGVYIDNRASTEEYTIFTASVHNPIEQRILEIDDFKSKYYRDLMFDNFISKSGKPKKKRHYLDDLGIENNDKECYETKKRNAKKRLGLYSSAVKAHMAWKSERHQYAIQLADIESKRKNCDERIVKALKTRFSEESEWLLANGR